ncbi:MAG: hypothetical protein ACREPD_08430 [Stenotrophomonas sp.]
MARLISRRGVLAMGPVIGEGQSSLCGISDVAIGKYCRLPTTRVTRFGSHAPNPPAEPAGTDTARGDPRQPPRTPVASATLDAAYRKQDYHITAWQPQGKPAFVLLIALKDRQWIQPDVVEAADFDEVFRNAVAFVERVLDGEAER